MLLYIQDKKYILEVTMFKKSTLINSLGVLNFLSFSFLPALPVYITVKIQNCAILN